MGGASSPKLVMKKVLSCAGGHFRAFGRRGQRTNWRKNRDATEARSSQSEGRGERRGGTPPVFWQRVCNMLKKKEMSCRARQKSEARVRKPLKNRELTCRGGQKRPVDGRQNSAMDTPTPQAVCNCRLQRTYGHCEEGRGNSGTPRGRGIASTRTRGRIAREYWKG